MPSGIDRGLSWSVESLRLTTFVKEPQAPGAGWELVVGEPPEIKTDKPREQIVDERGPFADGQLVFLSQPTRVDWLYTTAEAALGEMPALEFNEGLLHFKPVTDKWWATARGVHRVAFGAILRAPVSDKEAGYEALQRYVHSLRLTPGTTSELIFQINRPRMSQVLQGLQVNRLTKWSVLQSQKLNITLSLGTMAPLGDPAYACRLEMDLSTDAQRVDPFPPDLMPDLWRELGVLAVEITEKGETP